jgi:hypothetical protein
MGQMSSWKVSAGVLGGPRQPGVAVLDRRRMRVLGGEPVVDRDGDATNLLDERLDPRFLVLDAAGDHPAAVYPVQTRKSYRGADGPVDPHPDIGCVLRSWYRVILGDDAVVGRQASWPCGEQFVGAGARSRNVVEVDQGSGPLVRRQHL